MLVITIHQRYRQTDVWTTCHDNTKQSKMEKICISKISINQFYLTYETV